MKLYLLGIAFILSSIGFGLSEMLVGFEDWIAIFSILIGIVLVIVGVCSKYKKVEISKMRIYLLGIAVILFGYFLFEIGGLSRAVFTVAEIVMFIGLLISVVGAVKGENQTE